MEKKLYLSPSKAPVTAELLCRMMSALDNHVGPITHVSVNERFTVESCCRRSVSKHSEFCT